MILAKPAIAAALAVALGFSYAAVASAPGWLEIGEALARNAPAQPAPDASSAPTEARYEPPAADQRLVPWVDYTGDLWHRSALTGNWDGRRQQMMDKGLRFNTSLTQVIQGNVHGGVSQRVWYMGNARYDLDLDTGAAGLWPGGKIHLRGETQYGRHDNLDSGALAPVNTDALYPELNRDETALSEAYITQFVAPWLGFIGGKISPREHNVFASDETTQFMNAAFNYNPAEGMTVPRDFLGAGVILRPTDWFTLRTVVLDSEGTASVSGFDTAFHRGTTLYQVAEFAVKPIDQQGHQRFSWTWSDRTRTPLRFDPPVNLERLDVGLRPLAPTQNNDWSIMYDFDQYLYTKPGTKDEGFGLFGRFGVTDGSVNPVQYFYSIGVGGKGMLPGRENDTYGVGYYNISVSDKMGPILSQVIRDEQGVEVYYNIAVTPWLHITPNIQVIEPGRALFPDAAVVLGIRMRIDF